MQQNSHNVDIIVVGAGSGGLNVASFCNRIGLSVVLIDRSDEHIGGDCLNYGCVPSKALIHVAREVRAARSVSDFGLNVVGQVDIARIMQYVRDRQNIIREHEHAEYFRSKGIIVELGEASFTGERAVSINGTKYTAKNIVLATGSRPRPLLLPGFETLPVYTNETIFSMTQLPKRFVFVGGGPISIELGQAFSFLGSEVTIVHSGSRILEKEAPEVSVFMEKQLREQGVSFVFDAKPLKVEGGDMAIQTKNGEKRIHCDAVFVGIGRVLNTENLDLEKAGIEKTADGSRLIIDEYLRTTNKRVWAVGDIAGNYQFTHAAEEHAKVVINNVINPLKKKFQTHMAWVTYTSPEVATFSRSHNELEKTGTMHEVVTVPLSEDDRAIIDSAEGFISLSIGARGRIFGGTLVAPNAGEIVGELILAESQGLSAIDLFNRVAPYPTASRIIRKAVGKHEGNRLTEWTKTILKILYRMKV
ncbi:NAD(P)/FAD-dependent oxidoreductase [bacterium]|nr:NAD(P)/FAD-dependent oxidoreductase [bacterium]